MVRQAAPAGVVRDQVNPAEEDNGGVAEKSAEWALRLRAVSS
jgi:hypothetical protein